MAIELQVNSSFALPDPQLAVTSYDYPAGPTGPWFAGHGNQPSEPMKIDRHASIVELAMIHSVPPLESRG